MLYGLLLTFGLAFDHPGRVQKFFGSSGMTLWIPDELRGCMNLGFMT